MLFVSDVVSLVAAGYLATVVRFGQWRHVAAIGPPGTAVTFARIALLMVGVWVLVMWFERLYDLNRVFWGTGEFTRVAKAILMGTAGFVIIQYSLRMPSLSRLWMLLITAFAALFVICGRALVRIAIQAARRSGRLMRPTLIVGDNEEAAAITRVLLNNVHAGMAPVGYLASSRTATFGSSGHIDGVVLLGGAEEIREVLAERYVDALVIASTAFEPAALSRIIDALRGWDGDIQLSAGLLDVTAARVLVREVAGLPLITVQSVCFTGARRLSKRAFDLAVSGLLIVLGMPVWLFIAASIKIGSPGPVLYRQIRIGRNGKPFSMLKFRSMRTDAGAGAVETATVLAEGVSANILKLRHDPRVTSFGRMLRRYSLDEFPQLLNVYRGEMSLVGPRPEQACEVEHYEEDHMRRLDVSPGLTGLWQVSGRSDLSIDEKMRLDLYYVENWSLAGDFGILFRTVPVVLFGKGAY